MKKGSEKLKILFEYNNQKLLQKTGKIYISSKFQQNT